MLSPVAMGTYEITWIYAPDREDVTHPAPPPGWNVQFLAPDDALTLLPGGQCSAVVLDCPLLGWSTADLLEVIQRLVPGVPILMRDPAATPASAVHLARLGVQHFLPISGDPFAAIETVIKDGRSADLARLASNVESAPWERFLVGSSHAEIAAVMGSSEEAARRNVHEGLKRLRMEHGDEGN